MIVYKQESYDIIGACYEVYKEMGSGYLEAVYQECLGIELNKKAIPFTEQPLLTLQYKDVTLKQTYKPDFICYNKIIVEIKAVKELSKEAHMQVFNYLHATKLKLGFLVNFGHFPKLEYKRIVL